MSQSGHIDNSNASVKSDPLDSSKLPDAIKVALFLLPGFITQRVSQYYSTGSKLSDVEIIASALAFTFVNVGIALVFRKVWEKRRLKESVRLGNLLESRSFFVLVFIISLAVGAVWAMIDSSDLFFRIPLTSRVSRSPVWEKVFRENRNQWHNFVKITMKDGRIYHGNPRFFSEGGGEKAVFVSPAFIEKPSGSLHAPSSARSCVRVSGKGILLLQQSIASIEFRTLPEKKEYPCPGPR